MSRLISFLLFSFLVLAIHGCAGINASQDLSPSSHAAIPANTNPVMVKVISRTPVSKPIVVENGQPNAPTSINSTIEGRDQVANKTAENPSEYQVVFEYKGQTFATLLPYDPGENLLIQGDAQNTNAPPANAYANSTINNFNGLNEIYVLPPAGWVPYPYGAYGFFTAFPVYFRAGYYHRLPGNSFYNQGNHLHHSGARGRGRR